MPTSGAGATNRRLSDVVTQGRLAAAILAKGPHLPLAGHLSRGAKYEFIVGDSVDEALITVWVQAT